MTVRWTAAPLLALALLAAGCGGDDETATDQPATAPATAPASATSSSPVTTAPSPAPSPSTSATPTPTPSTTFSRVPPATRPVVVPSAAGSTVLLSADGLGFVSSGSTRQVPFGAGATTITSALSSSLGKGRTRALPDCGQGPRTQVDFDGFTILLASGAFVGWTENGSSERDLMTADGLALQVTLAQVRQALPDARVRTGSLGPEFTSETGVSGLLDGTAAQSRVTLLYGGETCFFR